MKEPEDEAFEELAKRQGDWGLQGSRKHQILRFAENVESKGTSMTPQQIEALKLALEALEADELDMVDDGSGNMVFRKEQAITAIKEALAEHAMRETQRLGQEIEQEPDRTGMVYYKNDACKAKDAYADDCICWTKAQPEQEPVAWAHYDTFKNLGSLTRARFTATLATKNTGACCIALYTHPINQKEFK